MLAYEGDSFWFFGAGRHIPLWCRILGAILARRLKSLRKLLKRGELPRSALF